MSSKIVSTTNPTIHIQSKTSQTSRTQIPHSFSFNSQLVKSRISTRIHSGPGRARAAARVSAFYAPAQTKETLYELLGIAESGSSFSDIKRAYKEMARKYHPDVSPPERVDEYTRRFIMVHEAYETLSDPHTRAIYDRDLALGSDFSFSPRKHRNDNKDAEEKEEWQSMWKSQLDELQRRDCRERSSWGARMRNC